jgi:hypothetical protein
MPSTNRIKMEKKIEHGKKRRKKMDITLNKLRVFKHKEIQVKVSITVGGGNRLG